MGCFSGISVRFGLLLKVLQFGAFIAVCVVTVLEFRGLRVKFNMAEVDLELQKSALRKIQSSPRCPFLKPSSNS